MLGSPPRSKIAPRTPGWFAGNPPQPKSTGWGLVSQGDTQWFRFLGSRHAGVFDVGVLEPLRNQGIGRALVRHACAFAQEQGADSAILIATNMGYSMYQHVGFEEVARTGVS